MKQLALLMVLVLASGSASANPSTCWTKDACKAYVGKRLWVSVPAGNPDVVEVTFTRNDWTPSRILQLKSGASFLVIDLASPPYDYVVQLDDGRTGWVRSSTPFFLDYDPVARAKTAQEECARRGQPRVGMSRDELIETCWGKPGRIVKRTTAAGIEETYIYEADSAVKLTDGKVSEIVQEAH